MVRESADLSNAMKETYCCRCVSAFEEFLFVQCTALVVNSLHMT